MKLIGFRSQAGGAFKLGIETGDNVCDLSSRFMTIPTGAPCGVGGLRKIVLKQGDVLRVEVETVGVLQNPVVDA